MKRFVVAVALVLGATACSAVVPGQAVSVRTGQTTANAMRQWRVGGAQYNGVGAWMYNDELVVATNVAVTAYDRASGAARWRTQAPGSGQAFCGASTSVSNGTVSLGYGAQQSNPSEIACEYVTVLDLGTGKLGWSAHVPTVAELQQQMHANGLVTEVAGQTVVVGWTGVLAGYDLATGKQRYRELIYPNGDYSPFDVKDIAVVGDTAYFLVHTAAPLSAGMSPETVFAGNVSTGQGVGKADIDTAGFGFKEPDAGAFVSKSPLTALVYDLQTSAARYVTFDSQLKVVSTVDPGPLLDANSSPVPSSLDTSRLDVGANDYSHQPYRTLLGNGSLFSVTVQNTGNQVVDVDMATGERRWAVSLPGMTMLMPVALDGSTLVVAAVGKAVDAPVTVVRVDANSGRVISQTAGSVPMDAPVASDFLFLWADHRVYGLDWGMANAANNVVAVAVG